MTLQVIVIMSGNTKLKVSFQKRNVFRIVKTIFKYRINIKRDMGFMLMRRNTKTELTKLYQENNKQKSSSI